MNKRQADDLEMKVIHKKYDVSNVKTITLNGKKYIDMSVIEDIKAEITAEKDFCATTSYYTRLGFETALAIIDRKVNEGDKCES